MNGNAANQCFTPPKTGVLGSAISTNGKAMFSSKSAPVAASSDRPAPPSEPQACPRAIAIQRSRPHTNISVNMPTSIDARITNGVVTPVSTNG